MTRSLYIGDLHFDCRRNVGTTAESVYQMELDKLDKLELVIHEIQPDVIYILGDLLDRAVVEDKYKVALIKLFQRYDGKWVIIRGNHDNRSNRYDKLCSLELISKLTGGNVTVVYDKPQRMDNSYCIPHVFDQAEFDEALSDVPPNTAVLLHTNVMSGFADSELSLNLDRGQIDTLFENGNTIITGHEHAHSRKFKDRLIVLGCFQPTSIADCDGDKYVMVKEDGKTEFIKVWDKFKEYIKVDWTETQLIEGQSIIEVVGEVTIAESIEAAKVVSELRKKSKAYIVKNSVKVINANISISSEDVTNFNIMNIFKRALDKETRTIVEEIINEPLDQA